MNTAFKAAGISYVRYAEACAQAVRNVMKEDLRAVAARRSDVGIKYAKWEGGKAGEQKWVRPPKEE